MLLELTKTDSNDFIVEKWDMELLLLCCDFIVSSETELLISRTETPDLLIDDDFLVSIEPNIDLDDIKFEDEEFDCSTVIELLGKFE